MHKENTKVHEDYLCVLYSFVYLCGIIFFFLSHYSRTFAADLVLDPDNYRDRIKREVSQNLTLSP